MAVATVVGYQWWNTLIQQYPVQLIRDHQGQSLSQQSIADRRVYMPPLRPSAARDNLDLPRFTFPRAPYLLFSSSGYRTSTSMDIITKHKNRRYEVYPCECALRSDFRAGFWIVGRQSSSGELRSLNSSTQM